MECERRTTDRLPKVAGLLCAVDRRLQPLNRKWVLGAAVDVALSRSHRVRSDPHSFEDAVRVTLEDRPIHERTRGALVRIAHDVLRSGDLLGDSRPLQSGRIPGAAAPSQTAAGDLINDLLRGHLCHGLGQAAVALPGNVVIDALGIDVAAILEHDLDLPFKERLAFRLWR